jgi:protein-L-isoaspartate(D-aspartate) O-methyltransferase
MSSIQDFRNFYARYVVGNYGKIDDRLVAAFAAVEREHYVGPGPWKISTRVSGYLDTIIDDPRILYQDVLIGLITERHINNGQPSLHARCLATCNPKSGESVVHIGTGTGYYTAILAELVGTAATIVGYEIDGTLADKARHNLGHLPNVKIISAAGGDVPLPKADVLYVNAAATHPLPAWLDALKLGGRLIFPLSPDKEAGCMLLIVRLGETKYAAGAVIGAAFTPCIGARNEAMSEVLAQAMKRQPMTAIKSLRRNNSPDASAWCVGEGWWLSTKDPVD